MNAQGQDKLLSAIDNPSVGYVPGGFDGRTFSADYYDDDFRRFKMKKYKDSAEPFQSGGYEELGYKSQDEEDRAEYEKKVSDFANSTTRLNKIQNTHIPLAWSLRNIDNDKSRMALDALNGKMEYSEVQKRYNDDLFKLSVKYGVNPEDIQEWQQRDWRGAIAGTTEVINDVRDVGIKAGIGASIITGISTAIGAGIGLLGGAGGAAAGATAGSQVGMKIAGRTIFPVAVFQDTFVKEAGNMAANYMEANPNMTAQEKENLKKAVTGYGIGSALLEAGMAEFLGPYIGKTALAIPGIKKVAAPMLSKAAETSSKQFSKFLSTEAGKEFLKETAKITGAEITTEEAQYFLELATTEYVRANAEMEIEQRIKDLKSDPNKNAQNLSRFKASINPEDYRTKLSDKEQKEFDKWANEMRKSGGIHPQDNFQDYDMQGFWKNEVLKKTNLAGGNVEAHFTDKYKMPNHASFSNESMYAVGANARYAGRWEGDKFIAPTLETPDAEIARLQNELDSRRAQKQTPQDIAAGAKQTALATIQATMLLAPIGAGASVKARVHNQIANNINEQIDSIDTKAGLVPENQQTQVETQTETPVLEGRVEMNNLEEMTPQQLQKSYAEQNLKIKDLDSQIASSQARIESAVDLGLEETEVTQLKQQVSDLTKQKEVETEYLKKIGTERAIKQATEETNAKLEKVNQNIEKTNADIESVQEKLKEAKEAGKPTDVLEKRLEGLETKLAGLEVNQESLLQDQVRLTKRVGLDKVFEGKKTTIASTTLANIEARAEEATAKADAKAATKINKVLEKAATDKINALIKSERQQANKFVGGYIQGTKEQIKETKDIRRTLYETLRTAGIKKKELTKFDSISKNIVTVQDLAANREKLVEKIKEVYEDRNKEIALKVTEKLRKLAKPLKAGKPPKGKMTADIQNKVNRLFSFTKRGLFETGLDIKALYERFGQNPNQELNTEEKTTLINDEKNNIILANQAEINNLKSDKELNKIKWEGNNLKREGRLSEDTLIANVKDYQALKPEAINEQEQTSFDKIESDVKKTLSNVLNVINMGFDFKNLNVVIRSGVFYQTNVSPYTGRFQKSTNTIEVIEDAEFTITHELGHYFDKLLNTVFNGDSYELFTSNKKIEDPNAKSVIQKFNTFIKAEKARIKKGEIYKNLGPRHQEYILKDSEIFARTFNALSNKINKTGKVNPEIGAIADLTNEIPDTSINEFISVLNAIAKYKEVGARIRELELENRELEKSIQDTNKELSSKARENAAKKLPDTVAELVFELELAADLKNRTSEEINAFNEYVAQLIYEGRDIRQQKQEAKKAIREEKIAKTLNKLQEFAPKTKDGKLRTNKLLDIYNIVGANWKSKLNMFFGKDIAEEFNLIAEEAQRDAFVYEEKLKFKQKAKEVYGFKNDYDLSKLTSEYIRDVDTYIENIKENPQKVRLNKMQILSAWIYNQNEIGRTRLENMFDANELGRMFSKLTKEDMAFADLLIETSESYYDTINNIFREDRGIDLPRRDRYFPFISEAEITDLPSFMDNSFGTVNGLPSFTKDVTPSKNIRLNLGNPISTLFTHIANVGEYANLYEKTKEISIMFNDERLKQAIRYHYGELNYKSFMTTLKNISLMSRVRDNIMATNVFDKLAANYIVSKIALKPTIAIKQVLSFINYAENMPISDFITYQAEFMLNPKKAIDFMLQDEYLKARFGQGSEVFELSNAMETSSFSRTGRLMDWLTLNVRIGDMGAIVLGGYSQVRYLMDKKGMTKEQAFKQFRKDTADSQQFSSTSSLSDLQNYARKNALARMLFAFTNTPFQYHRKLVDATIQLSRGEMSKEQYSKTVMIYQVLNPIMYNMATSLTPLALALGWDDEDEREKIMREMLIQDMLGGVLTGNTTLVPFVSDLPSQVFRLATGEKMYRPDTQFFAQETYDILKTSADIVSSLAQGNPEDVKLDDFLKVVTDIGEIWKGLPLDYTINTVEGINNLREEETRLQGILEIMGYTNKRSKTIASYAK